MRFLRWTYLLFAVAISLPSAGCLVPLPLEQEAAPDGGLLLQVIDSDPKFGVQSLTKSTDQVQYQLDVLTDSPQVKGRLYVQLNGTCCDLGVDATPPTARFLLQADPRLIEMGMQTGSMDRYTIDFSQRVQPCNMSASSSLVFMVPVVATEGFADGTTGYHPEGLGTVDRSHYWTVICP